MKSSLLQPSAPCLRATTSYLLGRSLYSPSCQSKFIEQQGGKLTSRGQCAHLSTTSRRLKLDPKIASLLQNSSKWTDPSSRKPAVAPLSPSSPSSQSGKFGVNNKSGLPLQSSSGGGGVVSTTPAWYDKSSAQPVSWDTLRTQTVKKAPSKVRRDQEMAINLVQDTNAEVSDMLMLSKRNLTGTESILGTPRNRGMSAAAADLAQQMTKRRPFFRRKPETGKMVAVRGTVDLAGAIALVGSRCSSNRVAQTMRRQMEHERPGLKRKRLRSERWKKCFSEGFKAAVNRANKLSKMGW